jgi:1-phosphatidylinositol-4-phosphate 5-kinase
MIKEYAGIVFNSIRKLYGYNKDSFIQSISPQVFITEMIISNTTSIEELFNTGSSGSLFYYTRDGKFILKTISKNEYKTMKRILPKYYYHLINYKNTFLPKFFGCYKLIKKVKKKKIFVYFIIMMNVFCTNKQIHVKFDLKGSTIGREVIPKKDKYNKCFDDILGKYSFSLKDLDFDYFKKNIYINDSIYNNFIEQLNLDSLLLKECNINDYSLLVGIHKIKSCLIKKNNTNITNIYNNTNDCNNSNNNISLLSNNIEFNKKHHSKDDINDYNNLKKTDKNDDYLSENISFTSINNQDKNNSEYKINKSMDYNKEILLDDNGIYNDNHKEIYYIGMIDILTDYNALKKCEYYYKSIRYCNNKMSCISPGKYQSRFINYLRQKILPNSQDIKNDNNKNFKLNNKINTLDDRNNKKIMLSNQINLSEEKLTSKNKSEIMLNKTNVLFDHIIH